MRYAALAALVITALWGYSALSAPRPTGHGTYRTASAPAELPATTFAAFAAG